MKQNSLSAGAVPLRLKNNNWEVLLLRAFKYWDFPKGNVEKDEAPWEAALRELKEETGLVPVKTPFDKIFFETSPYGKGKVARYYIIVCDEQSEVVFLPNPETGILEHHEYRWLKPEKARDLLVPRVQEVLDWVTEHLATLG